MRRGADPGSVDTPDTADQTNGDSYHTAYILDDLFRLEIDI